MWLYRIFRLFICPHKWMQQEWRRTKWNDGYITAWFQCSRCGKTKRMIVEDGPAKKKAKGQ